MKALQRLLSCNVRHCGLVESARTFIYFILFIIYSFIT